ncbi:MAG: hypothetical protein JNL94_00725 [Planctomycetes bacterium]|nr:hypothetical protein [Planctomycetota bacterium]
MSDTLTVWSREPFTDERRLPQNTRWSVEPTGFVYAAPQWRIVVTPSESIDPRSVPRELTAAREHAQFRTDVRIVPFDVPEAARELFEWTARMVAMTTRGVVTAADPRSRAHRVVTFAKRSRATDPTIALPSTELLMPRDTDWRARYRVWIAVAVVAFLASLLAVYLSANRRSTSGVSARERRAAKWALPFDAARWREAEGRDESVRVRMLADLIDGRTLIGQPIASVHELLGAPFGRPTTGSAAMDAKLAAWAFAFRVGSETASPNAIDQSAYLVVRLSDEGVVDAVGVVWP